MNLVYLGFGIYNICWFWNLNTVGAAAKWWKWSHVRLNQNSSGDSNGVDMLKETAGFVLCYNSQKSKWNPAANNLD